MTLKKRYTYEELLTCGHGELFGPGNAQLPLPPMLMFDRITRISDFGGLNGRGEVDVSASIKGLSYDCLLADEVKKGDEVVVSVRPENVLVSTDKFNGNSIEGRVDLAIFLGNCVDCRITSGDYEWKVLTHPRQNLNKGDRVFLRPDPEHTLAVIP